MFFPHVIVWGSCFSVVHSRRPQPPPHTQLFTHVFVTHNLHTQLCHTQLPHTDNSFQHNLLTHNLLTHNFVTHNFVTHTHNFLTLSHTTHNSFTHTQNFVTHNFLTHTHLPHTQVFHTQLFRTQLFHAQLCYLSRNCCDAVVLLRYVWPAKRATGVIRCQTCHTKLPLPHTKCHSNPPAKRATRASPAPQSATQSERRCHRCRKRYADVTKCHACQTKCCDAPWRLEPAV